MHLNLYLVVMFVANVFEYCYNKQLKHSTQDKILICCTNSQLTHFADTHSTCMVQYVVQ